MKIAFAIHHATNNAPGIRCFSDPDVPDKGRAYAERRVTRAGNSLDDLHEVDGVFVYWPPARGPFPSEATLAQWEAEYDAHLALEEKRAAALKAIEEAERQDRMAAALADPDAPAAVKAYAAALDAKR